MVDHVEKNGAGDGARLWVRLVIEARLDELEIPIAELAPKEAIERAGRLVESETLEVDIRLSNRGAAVQ